MCRHQLLVFSKPHNYFPTKSPNTAIHFRQRCTNFLNPSFKKIVFCFFSHFLTADFTSSSQLKRWPFKCSFSSGNRWKSLGARSGLYGGCGSTEKSRRWIASLVAALVWGLALSCSRSVSFLIPIRSILLFNSVSFNVTVTVYCCFFFKIVCKNKTLQVPKNSQHDLSSRGLCFEFFRLRWFLMAVLHGLPFVLRVIMMGPIFIACNDLLLEVLTFFFNTFQEFPRNANSFTLHFIRQHARYSSGTNFLESKNTNNVSHPLLRNS